MATSSARKTSPERARWPGWLATGALLTLAMLTLTGTLSAWLDSPAARELFLAAWLVSALAQPLSALVFVTDGVHWGTADYAYLRNGMLVATSLGILALLGIDPRTSSALTQVWVATTGWLAVRTAFGLARIWPGVGRSPLRTT